jgi:hypothetical protein
MTDRWIRIENRVKLRKKTPNQLLLKEKVLLEQDFLRKTSGPARTFRQENRANAIPIPAGQGIVSVCMRGSSQMRMNGVQCTPLRSARLLTLGAES